MEISFDCGRIVGRGLVEASSRDEARDQILDEYPFARLSGLFPAGRDASSGKWEYEVELTGSWSRRWPVGKSRAVDR